MHNQSSGLVNEAHKLLCGVDKQTDYLISARRPYLNIINNNKKRICRTVDFAVPVYHGVKLKVSEKKK